MTDTIPPPPPDEGAAADNETMNMTTAPGIKGEGWEVQGMSDEAAMLIYNGVTVGRLYGGAPITMMLKKLNA